MELSRYHSHFGRSTFIGANYGAAKHLLSEIQDYRCRRQTWGLPRHRPFPISLVARQRTGAKINVAFSHRGNQLDTLSPMLQDFSQTSDKSLRRMELGASFARKVNPPDGRYHAQNGHVRK